MRKYQAAMLVLVLMWLMLLQLPSSAIDSGWIDGSWSFITSAAAQESPATPATSTDPESVAEDPGGQNSLMNLAIIIGCIGLPYALGIGLANALKLKTHGWKLGVIFASLVSSVVIVSTMWPPKYGIDLQGGVILIYEVDEELTKKQLAIQQLAEGEEEGEAEEESSSSNAVFEMGELVTQLKLRVNPSGLRDLSIIPYGKNQIEITIPNNEVSDLELLKEKITTAGFLEFMIVANKSDHNRFFDLARDAAEKPDFLDLDDGFVRDSENRIVAKWVGLANDEDGNPRFDAGRPLGVSIDKQPVESSRGYLIRNGFSGSTTEILMKVEQEPLTGNHLSSASKSFDTQKGGGRAVSFRMNTLGASLMGQLTSENMPEGSLERQLGIVMDGELISAPSIRGRISDSGQITGQFTEQDIEVLVSVLKAGKLPAVLRKEPNSEQKISATLGEDTIAKGKFAVTVSLVAVLIFMIVFYHTAGLVACFALMFNLVLTLAIMILLQANLTLPGIAGLVLTVGMSVDANVLIFERIREELKNGASLRMALANGFDKATTTIVDANITTLITAAVLYRIGTDQVRGFSVTLIFGILMSMFTAIFCARIIFDIADRKGWIKSLSMLPSVSGSHIDFISKRKVAGVISLVVILIGLAGVFNRGKSLFDIDFNGGSSVQVYLKEPMPIAEIRAKLTGKLPDLAVSGVNVEGSEDKIYKIDTSMVGFSQLGKLKLTDHAGKSLEVDLAKTNELAEATANDDTVETLRPLGVIAKLITEAGTGLEARINDENDGLVLVDTSEAEGGKMSISSADDTETAERLMMSFSSDAKRYETGRIPSGVEVVQAELERIFVNAQGESMLIMHSMEQIGDLESIEVKEVSRPGDTPEATDSNTPADTNPMETTIEPEPSETKTEDAKPSDSEEVKEDTEEEAPEEKKEEEKPEAGDQSRSDLPDDSYVAYAGNPLFLLAQADAEPKAEEKKEEEAPAEEAKPMEEAPAAEPTEEPATEAPKEDAPETTDANNSAPINLPGNNFAMPGIDAGPSPLKTKVTLKFDEEITAEALFNKVIDASEAVKTSSRPRVNLYKEGEPIKSNSSVNSQEWEVRFSTDNAETAKIIAGIQTNLASTPVWPSSSKIGSKIAGDMQTMAYGALIFSLLGIIGYIWFRFQNVSFGLAAVVALVHDVLVTLGAIGISGYLSGFAMIEEFKISLPVVAAFLTIIGYSLNDTIVVFDRIREVRGKSSDLTQEMINISLNQTLGRTLLTSITTFLVVIILYFLGGQGIHSFAYSLVIGVIVGTYSSIFIASPTLLWLMNREKAAAEKAKANR